MYQNWTVVGATFFCVLSGTGSAWTEEFSLTGKYEGLYACDSTTAGVPSTWSRPMSAGIIETDGRIAIDLLYTDKQELGAEYSLYEGQISVSASHGLVSGYFEACGGSFPSKELARIFPSVIDVGDLSFSVTSVWASDEVPNIPGMTVQTCKWSLTRTSTDAPEIQRCGEDR